MCCLVLPPEIVIHDTYIGRHSENNIKCGVHDDLGWKNRTSCYNCRFSAATLALRVIFFSFIVVEHIRFFHGALQLSNQDLLGKTAIKMKCVFTCCVVLVCISVTSSSSSEVKVNGITLPRDLVQEQSTVEQVHSTHDGTESASTSNGCSAVKRKFSCEKRTEMYVKMLVYSCK